MVCKATNLPDIRFLVRQQRLECIDFIPEDRLHQLQGHCALSYSFASSLQSNCLVLIHVSPRLSATAFVCKCVCLMCRVTLMIVRGTMTPRRHSFPMHRHQNHHFLHFHVDFTGWSRRLPALVSPSLEAVMKASRKGVSQTQRADAAKVSYTLQNVLKSSTFPRPSPHE